MKTKIIFLCTVFLVTQTVAYSQKTQVSVQEGKVKAQTVTGEVIVEAGKKVILTEGKEPVVIVDNPLVEETIKIYKLVEAERKAQKEKIDSSAIGVIKIDDENVNTDAYLFEVKNTESESSNTYKLESDILTEPKFYDMQGNLLEFEFEKFKDNEKRGLYIVHFLKSVEPGDNYRCICVWKDLYSEGIPKEGPLRRLGRGWISPNHLSYFRYILPESAIFVDSSRPVTIIDSFDERIAVTFRIYTGPIGDGSVQIAFLWPDKDGTSLSDLPPQYRGLSADDEPEEDVQIEEQLTFEKVLAGETYDDQSTPLNTLFTFTSAIIRKDKELFLSVMEESIREIADLQYELVVNQYGSSIQDFDLLKSPDLPEKPENGSTYQIYLCRKGSQLRAVTITMVYNNGKWYWQNAEFNG